MLIIISAILNIVSLILTVKKVSRVLVCFFDFLLFEKIDPRNSIKFCVKNSNKYAKIFKMLTVAFSESTMSGTHVQLWYNRFKEGREEVNDDSSPGRSSTSTTDENIEAVKEMILDNR